VRLTKQGLPNLDDLGKRAEYPSAGEKRLQDVEQQLCEHAFICEKFFDECEFCGLQDDCVHLD